MLVDSHCHLDRVDLSPYGGDFDAMLDQARADGVGQFLCVCIDLEHYGEMRALVDAHPDVSVSVGVHPSERDGPEPDIEGLVALAADPKVVAVGETGLDYHYNEGDLDWQRERFRVHIEAAKRIGKPIIVHTRDARDDTIRILRESGAEQCGGVMHCFTETWEMANQALEMGLYISFSGILTFKNADALRDVARQVPSDRLLIETDSPYLAPVPHRGKRNEPRYVGHVAGCLAQLRRQTPEAIAELTARNYRRLFAPTGNDNAGAARANAAG